MTFHFRKQCWWLLGAIGLYVVIAAVVNTLVNPLRMEPAALSITEIDPYREIGSDLRNGKAGLVRYHHGVEVAVVGSSRFEISMDPLHPAFKGASVLNAAMAAGTLDESVAMARYLMARQPKLKILIFGLDMGDLSSDVDSRKFTSFYTSALVEGSFSLDREIQHVVGMRAFEESIRTLGHFFRREQPSHTALGRWVTPRNPSDLRAYIMSNRDFIFGQIPDMFSFRHQSLRSAKVAKLRSLFTDLRGRGVQVFVVIPPQLAIKQLHPFMNDLSTAPWNVDRRGIYELCLEVNAMDLLGGAKVQLWDFATFNDRTCVALPEFSGTVRQVPHWFDMGHFDVTIGNQMIDRMFGTAGPPVEESLSERFGINMLEAGINQDIEALRLGHARYCLEHPDDVAWARSLMETVKGNDSKLVGKTPEEAE